MVDVRLLIAAAPDDLHALTQIAEASGLPMRVQAARSAAEALASLVSAECDCLLLDHGVRGLNGLELLAETQRRAVTVPVIALTPAGDERLAVELMKAGAADAVGRRDLTPDRLARSIRHALAVADLVRLRATLLEREQRARRDAEAENAAKDQFLATLSHELRTPLSVILGWARLLSNGDLDDGQRARASDAIVENASALARHIDDLLDVSRIVSGTLALAPATLDVRSAIAAALESMRPSALARSVKLTSRLQGTERPVTADPGRLNQIVMNLVSNAIKFTPAGGRVDVRMEFGDERFVLEVRDTGIGIAPDFLPHVFSRFHQADPGASRHYGGLGIGLSIVQQLAELHGGSVSAASEGQGHGSTFSVSLPYGPTGAPDPEAPRKVDRHRLIGVSVLMVDDEPDSRELVSLLLEMEGATVQTAASAAAARSLLAGNHVDVLVSDLSMPGEDGYSFIQGVRRSEAARGAPGLPALALSAMARPVDRERAVRAGFDRYLAKPVEADALVAAIHALARDGGSGGPGVASRDGDRR